MNPPITTTLALIEAGLHPLGAALKPIKSYNGHAVFIRDRHYTGLAATVAMHYPRVNAKRHEFARANVDGRAVDLSSSTLGTTFETRQSALLPSAMNRQHIVWGVHIPLSGTQEAVVQIVFDKTAGTPPSLGTIEKAWESHETEIVTPLKDLAALNLPSLIEACRLGAPSTPNAFVLKWDVMDSSYVARHDYGELRHFISTFEHTIEPIVDYYGGHIAGYDGDSQDIVVPIPSDIDRNNPREIKAFAARAITPLIDKIRIAHATIAPDYTPVMRIRLGVGLGSVQTTLLGEQTGPVFWSVSDKMKMRAGSSDIYTLCLDDSVKTILT